MMKEKKYGYVIKKEEVEEKFDYFIEVIKTVLCMELKREIEILVKEEARERTLYAFKEMLYEDTESVGRTDLIVRVMQGLMATENIKKEKWMEIIIESFACSRSFKLSVRETLENITRLNMEIRDEEEEEKEDNEENRESNEEDRKSNDELEELTSSMSELSLEDKENNGESDNSIKRLVKSRKKKKKRRKEIEENKESEESKSEEERKRRKR